MFEGILQTHVPMSANVDGGLSEEEIFSLDFSSSHPD
jgi:hypothetical protein